MPKRMIGLRLFCLAGFFLAGNAYSANIIVNTTDDDTTSGKCSLRNAIALTNSADSNGALPTAGVKGCTGDTATIVLVSGQTYNLKSAITITKKVQINSLPSNNTTSAYQGINNAVIKMVGTDRLFVVDDGNPDIANIDVGFNQIDFIGCGTNGAAACATNGGLFYNRENLTLQYARMTNGIAANGGGAVFNDGIQNASAPSTSAGQLTLDHVFFANNQATLGGAVYSAQPHYEIISSVFRDNTTTGSGSATVYVQQPSSLVAGQVVSNTGTRTGNIRNSTFFNNHSSYVVNLLDGMLINNSTIVKNDGGVLLAALGGFANLSNSIVSDNGGQDCTLGSGNQAGTNNVVYRTGDCGNSPDSQNPNINLSTISHNQLIAGSTIDGACDLPPADGLLCPYHVDKNQFLGGFKPRLLVSYKAITDSPIVNRGRVFSNGTTLNTYQCENNDARGNAREATVLCDVGAIELTIGTPNPIGQDILYYQTANIDMTDDLGDGQLWPATNCDDVYADQPGFIKGTTKWQPGCMTASPSTYVPLKGSFSIDSNAMLKYTPFSNYHGTDFFNVNVVTTTTRFSQAVNDRALTLTGKVVMDPPDTFQNKTVHTGGATGLVSLLGLLGLVLLRRRNDMQGRGV